LEVELPLKQWNFVQTFLFLLTAEATFYRIWMLSLQMEMVGDISLAIPNLIAIFVSKMVADQLSKPLYKCQLENKALPHLDQEPKVFVAGKMCVSIDISNPVNKNTNFVFGLILY